MNKKLILLNGSASVGKSTITKLFLQENPLAIGVEGDQLISMMGCWRENEDEARMLVFQHTKQIAETHLKTGHSVLLPYLLTEPSQADEFERIAHDNNAEFIEIALFIEREEAVARLLERGVWGEEGSPKLTENDRPEIEALYDKMVSALKSRPNTHYIDVRKGDVQGTYNQFKEFLLA